MICCVGNNRTSQKMEASVPPQLFDYFLVLDFEATCEENKELTPQVMNVERFCKKMETTNFIPRGFDFLS